MSWLDSLIYGLRNVFTNGASPVAQSALNVTTPLTASEVPGSYVTLGISAVSSSVRGTTPLTTGADKLLVALADAASWAKLVNANVDAAEVDEDLFSKG